MQSFRAHPLRGFSAIASCLPWFLMIVATRLAIAGPVSSGRHIWVSAEDAGEVVAIDPAQGEAVIRVKVGRRPRGVKLSPDGKLLYVTVTGTPKPDPHGIVPKMTAADRAADGVAVVDVAAGTLLRTFASGSDPIAIDLSPDGRTAYVANGGSAELTVLDLDSGKIRKRIPVGKEPTGVTVQPNGRQVYVAASGANEVYAIDALKLELITRIDGGICPRSVVFSRNGAAAFAIDERIPEVTFLNVRKHLLLGHLQLADQAKTVFVPQPYAGVLSPDGKVLYISGGLGQSIFVVDVVTRKVLRAIDEVGQVPRGIGISRDGRKLFTANGPSNDVSIVDAASGKVEKRVVVGGGPWDLAVGATGPR